MEKDPLVQAEIISILSKKIEERTDTEWQLLYNYTSSISFFQKYVISGYKNIPQECCKVLQPLEMKKGDIVFYINTEGNKFYIIIQGEVGLFTKKVEEGPGNKFDNLVQVKNLEDGDYFGELGLLNFKTRSATVQCLTDCFFAVIDKASFDKILKKLEQDILQERIDAFGNENPLLKFSSKHTIKQLYFNAIFKKYAPNEFVIISGDSLEAIFIIKSGQYKLVKEYNRKTILNEDQEIDEEHEEKEYQVLNQDKYFLQLQKQKKKLISILDLGKGQIFGYEDFLQKNSVYSYGIVCKEAGEVIMIRANDFRKRLMSDKLTMIYLRQQMNLQINYIQHREATIVRSMEGFTQYYFEQDSQQDKAELITKMCVNSSGIKLDIPKTIVEKAKAQEKEDKQFKYNKVHSKLSHFKDELSQDFKSKIVKNYHEKFGNTEMSKLKVHVPQEIVQEVNYKLNKQKKLNVEKSPPQLSNSVLDYVKFKTGNIGQLIQNKSQSSLISSTKEFSTPIQIQSATIEFKNQSLQNSPTLGYLQSPMLSAKSHHQDYISESPIKTTQSSKRFLFVSQKALHSNISLPQSIEEIDELQNKTQSKIENYSQFNLNSQQDKRVRHQSELIQIQNYEINSNDLKENRPQFYQDLQTGNQQVWGDNYNFNKKTHSFHSESNRQVNNIDEKNIFGEEDQSSKNELKQPQNKQQKLQIFESIHLKKKKNLKNTNSMHEAQKIESIQENNFDLEDLNNNNNKQLQIKITQDSNFNSNKNTHQQVSDSPNLSSIQWSIQQAQIAQTPISLSQNNSQIQIEQIANNNIEKISQQNKYNNIINNIQRNNTLSPNFSYSPSNNNNNITNKIQQLQHSNSNDSNQSHKSKGNSNYCSLFKPYQQNQARYISSTFSQVDISNIESNKNSLKDKYLEKEVKYMISSGVKKNHIQKPKYLQTTSASSLGLSRQGNQLDQQEKDNEMSNNSVLSPLNSQNHYQISMQNFVESNIYNQSNSNLSQNQINNKTENFHLFTNENLQDVNNQKTDDIKKHLISNMQSKSLVYGNGISNSYFNSLKRDSTNSIPIYEIQEYPFQEQSKNNDKLNKQSSKNNISLISQRIHSQQNLKRMQTFSPSKKQETLIFNSRTSFGDIVNANLISEEAKKNPSQIIIDMLSQVENINSCKPKQDNKIFYRSSGGKKLSLSKSKPVYKFEQMESEENIKKLSKKNQQMQGNTEFTIPQFKSKSHLKFDRALSQILSPKGIQPAFKLNNSSQQIFRSPSMQLKKNEVSHLNNSINQTISTSKLNSPLKNINNHNPSSEFIKTKRPLSSINNKSNNLSQNQHFNSQVKLRPSSAKPIDFFQKILNKKFE
ncbi:cyclic nucleotide-binding domain protein (macronuclear) [Tetrahymena thermophila SB210]|uniref:Cyclic nucleotide-binding domain protein n=1 Tax=Tetrahymena thermophila (strain SB210) TaxID=312017 RepID=Q23HD3_TETTS|nr:cyclic nucleotide-binding domain protein [Tetrahymena thermophila SB210]EAR95875.3 cyclic nucleotide-binding domain protein [Tetrahymena thermophila SB210]|eukprot:XP_001016120.3 cyclic nucleotide-binding domain protein [Tetrahymena thermophila SB210]